MYLYDRPLTALPFSHDKDPVLQLSRNYRSTNCISDLHWHSTTGSMSGLASGDFSGVRLARVEQQGAVIHSGILGRGHVEVRGGEALRLEETRKGTPTGRATNVPGFLALEYKGDQTPVTKWLQFFWFELTANIPGVTNRAVFPGSLPSIGGSPRPFTTDINKPRWLVDSASTTDPFYETAGGLALRSPQTITIFDRPGMLIERAVPTVFKQAKQKSGVAATSVTFAAHYDTYLIQNNVAVYHVPWVATITFSYSERAQQKPPFYIVEGTPGPIATLPEYLRTILHSGYPGYVSIR